MKIIERNAQLTYTRDIQQEKMLLLLSWLLEFRFSSPRILALLLKQPVANTSRFFSTLLKDRFIRTFTNVHTNRERLFMLDQSGVDFLINHGFDLSQSCTKPHVLHRYRLILHDQAVQEAVIHKISRHREVIWDKNITHIDAVSRPDALMQMHTGYWVALDYERWRKSLNRVYLMYYHHAQAIEHGHYHGVYLYFHSHDDMLFYQQLFDSEKWPVFSKDTKTGKLSHTDQYYVPDQIKNLRSNFSFEVLCCEW
jgi:hypothetical protein